MCVVYVLCVLTFLDASTIRYATVPIIVIMHAIIGVKLQTIITIIDICGRDTCVHEESGHLLPLVGHLFYILKVARVALNHALQTQPARLKIHSTFKLLLFMC